MCIIGMWNVLTVMADQTSSLSSKHDLRNAFIGKKLKSLTIDVNHVWVKDVQTVNPTPANTNAARHPTTWFRHITGQ